MLNLLTAIKSKFIGSSLSTDVDGRIFYKESPQNSQFPYVVYFIVSDVPDNVFAKDGESVLMQFSLFSSSGGATEIATMYKDLKALLDDCSLTITSNNLVWFKRVNLTTMVDEITTVDGLQKVDHWAVDYEVTMQES